MPGPDTLCASSERKLFPVQDSRAARHNKTATKVYREPRPARTIRERRENCAFDREESPSWRIRLRYSPRQNAPSSLLTDSEPGPAPYPSSVRIRQSPGVHRDEAVVRGYGRAHAWTNTKAVCPLSYSPNLLLAFCNRSPAFSDPCTRPGDAPAHAYPGVR
jgi:hypothetical protein